MPARALCLLYARDEAGNTIPGALVEVRNATEPPGAVKISETIYQDDDPDVDTYPNPFTADSDGRIEFYLAAPKRVDLFITKSGFTSQTVRVDVMTLGAATITVKDEGTPLTQRTALNFGGDSVVATDDAGNSETDITINHKADAVHSADQPAAAHAIDGAKHTASGLTVGHVLRATGATTFAFGAIPFVGARATKSATQSITNATYTAVTFDGETFDTSAFHDNSTNPSRFTVPAGLAGKYRVSAIAAFARNATGWRAAGFSVNGAGVINEGATQAAFDGGAGPPSSFQGLVVSDVLNLAVGDYVELYVWQNSGAGLNVLTTCIFAIEFLGT